MWPFNSFKVGLKLALLAGIPVLGALLLSVWIARDAQERAASAAALGSIEDLAQLTDQMARVVHQLQLERARTAHAAARGEPSESAVLAQRHATDKELQALDTFLARRHVAELPTDLRRDLLVAREKLAHLPQMRETTERSEFEIDKYLEYIGSTNAALIGATAALTELSNDGELILAISRLVALMEVRERSSREHALLSYVFRKQEFPPGTFRYFVTLLTEQDVYAAAFRSSATPAQLAQFQRQLASPNAQRVLSMRKLALESTDERLEVDAEDWYQTQQAQLNGLRQLEVVMASQVREIAARKQSETRHTLRLGAALALIVVITSALIGWAISRGLTRSVRSLADTAERVQQHRDYAIRAVRTSRDELGLLTDAFNGMLADIQERDRELAAHRGNLEALVEARTKQLAERNEQMRLVLDNVEQALVMIDRDGRLAAESSACLGRWFGDAVPGSSFAEVLAGDDVTLRNTLQLGYEQLISDIFPMEVALDQLPKQFTRNGRQYSLRFDPVERDGSIAGVLLVVGDITAELAASHAETAQREHLKTFERVMRDRSGFLEFFDECRVLVEQVRADAFAAAAERLRAIHTLKGNTALFDVKSVSLAAHDLEHAIADGESDLIDKARARLCAAWDEFSAYIQPILGQGSDQQLQVTTADLDGILRAVHQHEPHAVLDRMLSRLRHEPVRLRFERIAEQLKGLARRLEKPVPEVLLDAGDLRLPSARFREFWATFAHVVRNVVDHGIESQDERTRRGKPRTPRVYLGARTEKHGITIEISDDGRGIDWMTLAEKAKRAGLAHADRSDLVQALFAAGVSTAAAATEISGRGVGMFAVHSACAAMGGVVQVESEPGRGTLLRFTFPTLTESSGQRTSTTGRPQRSSELPLA